MNRVKKGVLPLHGALHIYGKDKDGRKIILPTKYEPVKEKRSMSERFRRIFHRPKINYIPITASYANEVTKDYMNKVMITLNQYKWKNGKFIKDVHPAAFN